MKGYFALTFIVVSGLVLAACGGQMAEVEPTADSVSPLSVKSNPESASGANTTEGTAVADALPKVTEATSAPAIQLEDLGVAPEIANETWVNTDVPLTLTSQLGKVVLVEFWTFGCINCQRVIPYVKQWNNDYTGDDFQVISVHYPEFSYEEDYDNVARATQENGITYPVALDNDGRTWRAYQQRYWPTTYLIDKQGHIRYKHIGEFNARSAAEAEAAIAALLAETPVN